MIKIAGKTSSDPIQEKLRQSKKLWNKEVSAFIDDLINFKKMMNGQPSKFFKQKSFIKDPIPADPVTIIGVLSSDFNELAQKSTAIIQQQTEYSKNRRKKQDKTTPVSTIVAPPPATDLSSQLTASIENFELMALASNSVTRFFTRLLNPAIGKSPAARIRKYRMSLLNSSVDIYQNMKKLRSAVVGSSPESIFVSSKIFSRIEENWSFLMKGFETFKSSMPDTNLGGSLSAPGRSDSPTNGAVPTSSMDEVSALIEDYKKNISNFMDIDHKELHNLLLKLVTSKKEPLSKDEEAKLKKDIIDEYKKLLSALNAKYNVTGSSLKEIFELKSTKDKVVTAQLEKVAQDFLKKWYGKTRHQLSPFDKTSAIRLDIYKLSENTMKLVDKIMDSLEKGMNTAELDPLIKITNENMLSIRVLLGTLEATLRGQDFDKSFMKLLEKGDVTEHGRSLSDIEKKRLETVLERRRMTDLAKLYSGHAR